MYHTCNWWDWLSPEPKNKEEPWALTVVNYTKDEILGVRLRNTDNRFVLDFFDYKIDINGSKSFLIPYKVAIDLIEWETLPRNYVKKVYATPKSPYIILSTVLLQVP